MLCFGFGCSFELIRCCWLWLVDVVFGLWVVLLWLGWFDLFLCLRVWLSTLNGGVGGLYC